MPPSAGGHALALVGSGILLSNLSLGPVCDRFGARRLIILSFFVVSVLFFIWPHCSVESIDALAFLYGYLVSLISSLPIIILADAYGEIGSEYILVLNGITNIIKLPGYLLRPYIAGLIIEWADGSYIYAANCSGLTTLIGSLMLLCIPSPEKQLQQLSEIRKSEKFQDS